MTDFPQVSEDEKILDFIYFFHVNKLDFVIHVPSVLQSSTVRAELLKVINLGDVTMTTGALFAVNLGLPSTWYQ